MCVAAAAGFGNPLFADTMRYIKIALFGREVAETIDSLAVIRWQDAEGRQQHEIVTLCDRAIEIAIEEQLVGRGA